MSTQLLAAISIYVLFSIFYIIIYDILFNVDNYNILDPIKKSTVLGLIFHITFFPILLIKVILHYMCKFLLWKPFERNL